MHEGFDVAAHVAEGVDRNALLQSYLDELVRRDVAYLRTVQLRNRVGVWAPNASLYVSGVRYREEPWDARGERWRTVPEVLARGGGDCKDLSAWRAAELQLAGVDARPAWTCGRGEAGEVLCHVVVALPGGRTEDPSRLLGMR